MLSAQPLHIPPQEAGSLRATDRLGLGVAERVVQLSIIHTAVGIYAKQVVNALVVEASIVGLSRRVTKFLRQSNEAEMPP